MNNLYFLGYCLKDRQFSYLLGMGIIGHIFYSRETNFRLFSCWTRIFFFFILHQHLSFKNCRIRIVSLFMPIIYLLLYLVTYLGKTLDNPPPPSPSTHTRIHARKKRENEKRNINGYSFRSSVTHK